MARKNRKCLACDTKYAYCPSCSRVDAVAPSWKSEFCCESCMTLWGTLTKFGMGLINKTDARDVIANIDLQPIETYADCVQRDFAIVMAEEPKKRNKKVEMPVVEEMAKAEIAPMEQVHEVVE